jgi:bacillithiol system protein YtxJ
LGNNSRMSLRDRMYALATAQDVDQFLIENPVAAIFKAGTCHKTMQGWGNVEKLLRERDDVPVGVIRVVEQRPASNRVAERTGIVHHSPQMILFRNGQAQFDLDNWNITLENLEPLLDEHLPTASAVANAGATQSNVEPYRKLLRALVSDEITEQQFQWTYLSTFKNDASLRSQEEFAVLNSLFGNPDEHHIHPGPIIRQDNAQVEAEAVAPLKARAQALLDQLAAF